jgi:hypothetical protein
MKAFLQSTGILLISAALLWGMGILVFYGDSMMTYDHTLYYSFACLAMLGAGAIMFVRSRRLG